MKEVKYLIIGGGIAGTNAASSIREKDTTGSILLVTAENNRLYSRVLLPILLAENSPLEYAYLKKDHFYTDNQIEFWSGKLVVKVDTQNKIAILDHGEEIGFEKLLIATGGQPNRLGVAGEDLAGIFTCKTIEDAEKISSHLKKSKTGAVIGGRFIAFDFIDIFRAHALKTTLLVKEESLFQPFLDLEGSDLLVNILQKDSVEVKFNQKTKAFGGQGKVEKVITESGLEIETDMVGIGIGISSKLDFLTDQELITNNHVETGEYLETKAQDVWAAGDVTRFRDLTSGRYHSLGNWANAADQGRVAGLNMAGTKTVFVATSSYSINFFKTSLSLLGDPSKVFATEVIKRGSADREAYGNLFMKDDHIIGATLIGLPQDRGSVGNLIKNKVRIVDKSKIADLDFDLKTLLTP